jgi:uncharacterized protein (DUF1330 family)
MAKGYWVAAYRSAPDEVKLKAYASAAAPVLQALGGRFLARGTAAAAYEAGIVGRLVVIEFDSVRKAIEAYESPEYQATLALLQGSAERDLRIVEGA